MGKLIVIEGACDGIGKTTQYELLKKRLIEQGYKVISHHFPSYNEYQGKAVEKYLSGEFGNMTELSPYFINNLYATDRAITWHTKLKHDYEESIILLDRYTTSSLIYQSALIDNIEEKKKFINYVNDFEYNKLEIKKPDLVIFLNAPYELVENLRNQRKGNAGIENDIHENNQAFMNKVYKNALFIADYLNFSKIICNKNNNMKTINEINDEIYKLVEQTIKEKK